MAELMKRPVTAAAPTGLTFITILLLGILVCGCTNGATSAEDPVSSPSQGVAPKQPPKPTGSPYPKDAASREAQARAASPNPSLSEETGEVSIDDTLPMTHYVNRKFSARSAWRLKCGNWYDTLAVGAVDGAGYIVRGQVGVHGAYSKTRTLAAPSGFGALSIVSAGCDGVHVRDDTGKALTYLPTTNSWSD